MLACSPLFGPIVGCAAWLGWGLMRAFAGLQFRGFFFRGVAIPDDMTGGRMLWGSARGTVPREAEPLGTRVGWNNDPDDTYNREVFEEQVEIIKRAWHNETFAFEGKH